MKKNIIFDFDGVILDSVPVKTEAFKKLFIGFPEKKVEQLIKYHLKNGGKSRYLKIKYFFEDILQESISEDVINKFAKKYSQLTKEELSNSKYLIDNTLEFIKLNYKRYNFHIASGADEKDLKYICRELGLTQYFLSINGSPKVKSEIVKGILENHNYTEEETILIGDSMNDYDAAKENNIIFCGYNNKALQVKSNYLKTMNEVIFV